MKREMDPLKELKQELAKLKKQLGALEQQVAKGNARADVTCTSLSVVDSQGDLVASIDTNGILLCRAVGVAPNSNTRGVYVDGKNGSVQCLGISVLGRTGNAELVTIEGFTGSPSITLRGEGDGAGVRLQAFKGQGGVVDVTDNTGRNGVILLASDDVNIIEVANEKLGAGRVLIDATYVQNGDGVVYTVDQNDILTGQFPASSDGRPPTLLTERELRQKAGRKRTK